MKYLYDLIFLLFSIIYLPYLIIKGKAHKDFIQRFGILPRYLKGQRKDAVWVHAVSVGEVKATESFIRRLKESLPGQRIILSTTTKTGFEAAKKIFGDSIPRFYFPLDFHFIVEKTLKFINPLLFILFETEIWPNLIISLSNRSVPILLVNGRISDKSFRGYRLIKPLFAITLKKIDRFLMQTEEDARRIKLLGAPAGRVKVCGNVKYDIDINPKSEIQNQKQIQNSKSKIGINEDEKLIICGSTHKGEEGILLEAYRELLKDFHNLRMLIAPRHIDRTDDIEKLCGKYGFESMRLSKIDPQPTTRNPQPILILDTIGQLSQLYSLATIVFMGGSLIKRGGHNIIEPARFARPIIFGPYMNNFRDMANRFLSKGASIMVKDRHRLKESIRSLLKDKARIADIGKRAAFLVEENKGAVSGIIGEIKRIIS